MTPNVDKSRQGSWTNFCLFYVDVDCGQAEALKVNVAVMTQSISLKLQERSHKQATHKYIQKY